MGIPTTVYFLLCIQSTTHYVAVLPVLSADLVEVHTCLEVVVGTLDAWAQYSQSVGCEWYINHRCPKTVQVEMTVEQRQTLQQGHPIRSGTCQSVHTGQQFLMLPVYCLAIYSIMSSTDPFTSISTLHIAHLLVFVYLI